MSEFIVRETGYPGAIKQEVVGELIRCKDCRHYEWMSNRIPEEQTWFCHGWNSETGKDDFCSYAERREEGEQE